jgi:hypothetical protein
MALMEAPAIIIGVILVKIYSKGKDSFTKISTLIKHSFTNGSVLLILGSLLIGFLASEQQAMGIKPLLLIYLRDF